MKKSELVAAILISQIEMYYSQLSSATRISAFTKEEIERDFLEGHHRQRLSPRDLDNALQYLISETMCKVYATNLTRPRYHFYEGAIKAYAKRKTADQSSALHFVQLLGDDWVVEALDGFLQNPQVEDEIKITSGDVLDDWTPIRLDIETDAIKAQFAELEAEIRRIASDNGFAHNASEVRDGLLDSIESTLAAIKKGIASKARVEGGILKPLRWIAKKFVDTGIGEAAKKAIYWVLEIFKGFIE